MQKKPSQAAEHLLRRAKGNVRPELSRASATRVQRRAGATVGESPRTTYVPFHLLRVVK